MAQKSVPDLIFDKFAETIQEDNLFKGITGDLVASLRKEKLSKSNIERLLKKEQDEDSKPTS